MSKTKLWHTRLGHVSERGLVELGKQNLLGGKKVEKLELCEACVFGKAYGLKFNKGKQRARESLIIFILIFKGLKEIIHTQGKVFFSHIYDYSIKLWIFTQRLLA